MTTFAGSCLCGAVRFEIEPPTLFCAHCHCRFCRRAHGAAFVTWVGAAEDRFACTSGEDQVRWHQSTEQSRRGFCSTCGTTLFYTSILSPGEVHVARACIDGDIDREPKAHVFYDQRVPWGGLDEELPTYDGDHPVLAKYKAVK
jgi:hypothetical protein